MTWDAAMATFVLVGCPIIILAIGLYCTVKQTPRQRDW